MRWSSFFDTAHFWWMRNLIKISMTKSRAELKILKACLFSKERNIISFSSLGSSSVVFHSAVVWWRPDWWRPIYHKMSNQREREWERLCACVWARVSESVHVCEWEWESERVRELNHSEEKERGSINRTPYAHYCHGVIALFTTCYGGRQKKNNLFVSSSQPNHKQCIKSSFLLHVLTLLQCFTLIGKYCLFVLD